MTATRKFDARSVQNALLCLIILFVVTGAWFLPRLSFQGSFFYPFLAFYHSWLPYIVITSLVMIIGWSVQRNTQLENVMTMGCMALVVAVLMAGFWLMLNFFFSFERVLPGHFTSIHHENRTYYLAWLNVLGPDLDWTYDEYIVYECDDLGLMCHTLPRNMYSFSTSTTAVHSERHVNFVSVGDQLYVEIDSERFQVRTSAS